MEEVEQQKWGFLKFTYYDIDLNQLLDTSYGQLLQSARGNPWAKTCSGCCAHYSAAWARPSRYHSWRSQRWRAWSACWRWREAERTCPARHGWTPSVLSSPPTLSPEGAVANTDLCPVKGEVEGWCKESRGCSWGMQLSSSRALAWFNTQFGKGRLSSFSLTQWFKKSQNQEN